MGLREKDFLVDFGAGNNAEEAKKLKWWILNHLRMKGSATADEIYEKSECGDIAMYLALHELVMNDLIKGISPYDEDSPGNHKEMRYELENNSGASFFSEAARDMSEEWNPKEWS